MRRAAAGWLAVLALGVAVLAPSARADANAAEAARSALVVLARARFQADRTLEQLGRAPDPHARFPMVTEREADRDTVGVAEGEWTTGDANFWAAGSWPAVLWRLSLTSADPAERERWASHAIAWSSRLRATQLASPPGDVAVNNLTVFGPWMLAARDEVEREAAIAVIRAGAAALAKPWSTSALDGRFHPELGVIGYLRRADRNGRPTLFHVFIDHCANLDQLVGGALVAPDAATAADWRAKAISHLAGIRPHLHAGRPVTGKGSWQRGYFDHVVGSATYGQFRFAEGKQGWTDTSTWSRGQAWLSYGASVVAAATGDPGAMALARESLDHFLARLPDRREGETRRAGEFLPPWDFDYAEQVDPDTEADTSAAALVVAALARLVAVLPPGDPDRERYFADLARILAALAKPGVLNGAEDADRSLVKHGCYHHPACLNPTAYRENGLIWGDAFIVQAAADTLALVAAQGRGDVWLQSADGGWLATAGVLAEAPWQTSADLVSWSLGPSATAPLGVLLRPLVASAEARTAFWRPAP